MSKAEYDSPSASKPGNVQLFFQLPYDDMDEAIVSNAKAKFTPNMLIDPKKNPSLKTWLKGNYPEMKAMRVTFSCYEPGAAKGFGTKTKSDVESTVKALLEAMEDKRVQVVMVMPMKFNDFNEAEQEFLKTMRTRLIQVFKEQAAAAKKPLPLVLKNREAAEANSKPLMYYYNLEEAEKSVRFD